MKTFKMYMIFLLTIIIHPARKAPIAWLIVKKINILVQYLDFLDVFLKKRLWYYQKQLI